MMEEEPNFPVFDAKAVAGAFLSRAQQAGDSQQERLVVGAEQARQLAQKRLRLAWLTMPIFLLVGTAVLLISLDLALVAVSCAFFAYASITIALRQREAMRDAADFEVTVSGKQLQAAGRAPREIFMAVHRPDYLRPVLAPEKVAALWLDNRRDPDASIDLPPRWQVGSRCTKHSALLAFLSARKERRSGSSCCLAASPPLCSRLLQPAWR